MTRRYAIPFLSIRISLLAALAVLAVLLPGCGPQKAAESANPEEAQIAALIGNLPDYSDSVAKLGRKYSKDAQPTEAVRTKIAKYNYSLAGPVKFEGDTATAQVKLAEGANDKGAFEWVAVKEGGNWKLKTTPLP